MPYNKLLYYISERSSIVFTQPPAVGCIKLFRIIKFDSASINHFNTFTLRRLHAIKTGLCGEIRWLIVGSVANQNNYWPILIRIHVPNLYYCLNGSGRFLIYSYIDDYLTQTFALRTSRIWKAVSILGWLSNDHSRSSRREVTQPNNQILDLCPEINGHCREHFIFICCICFLVLKLLREYRLPGNLNISPFICHWILYNTSKVYHNKNVSRTLTCL